LNIIRDILMRVPGKQRQQDEICPDRRVAREFTETLLSSQWVAR